MKLKDNKSQPISPTPEKKWFEKLQIIVPILVALISGLFVLIPIYFPAKQARATVQPAKEYALIFIDRQTLKCSHGKRPFVVGVVAWSSKHSFDNSLRCT
jgi:hypothetical protein